MPVIDPVPLTELPPALAASVERGRASRMLSSTIPVQIWAHRPEAAAAWLNTLEQFYVNGCLDPRLRELVRLKIASITKCQACTIARKSDDVSEEDISCLAWNNARYSPREQAALHYAELFGYDYFDIDDRIHRELAAQFSVAETVELHMFCALMLAGGRMTYVQRGYPEQDEAVSGAGA